METHPSPCPCYKGSPDEHSSELSEVAGSEVVVSIHLISTMVASMIQKILQNEF